MMYRCSQRPSGFSLIEVTLAIGIAAFCLIALFGLLPVGVASNQTTLSQTVAAGMTASVVADLRATPVLPDVAAPSPATDPHSPLFGIPIPPNLAETLTSRTHTIFLRDDGTQAITTGTDPKQAVDQDADFSQSPRYRVTMIFMPPLQSLPVPPATPSTNYRGATTVRVLVTWPATADPRAAVAPTQYAGSLETVTALDRH